MIVHVRLNALLRKYASQGSAEFSLQIAEGCTVEEVIAQLAIPPPQVSFATVNLKHSSPSTTLKNGDRVTLFPPLTGG